MRKVQKKLRKSEQEAQIASKVKSEFLATMSHEIRTPMNGVPGVAQILKKTNLNEQQRFYIDIMSRSGDNLLAIINDILDFSKIEADKWELNLGTHNLDQTLHDVVSLLTPRATAKSIVIDYDFDSALAKNFRFDSQRVRQVFTNLLGNAIKFTPKGSIRVNVTGKTNPKDGKSHVKISIADTGIGISKEKIAMIFEEFTQAESSTTRNYGGTGLGLAISRKLVKAMNGRLSVKSQPGQGSTFTIKLPLSRAVGSNSAKPQIEARPRIKPVQDSTAPKPNLLPKKQIATKAKKLSAHHLSLIHI